MCGVLLHASILYTFTLYLKDKSPLLCGKFVYLYMTV